ncbi:hypothetical protein Q5762_12285 [Streptomyces sp. P9(2023)]|uniref:hypothetical protein n=1 Tax=Streptomyces sp. P9(2023) TaxID=3064394 RepID=UPI0028F40351|nr:hypothetical protein [Streptomyces sp. P9(2023)]MDT9689105.1 hypothetical protein [Streptomyces sp. P9(2023)]
MALTIAGLTAAAGSAAAAEQGDGQSAGQHGGQHGGPQWPVAVPPEVGELVCEIRASLPQLPQPSYLPDWPRPIQIPQCKPVNGWQ